MSTQKTKRPLGTFDDPKFAKLALTNAKKYQTNDPFPHISFDDFIDPEVAAAIHDAFPHPDSIDWIVRNNQNNLKRYQHDETKLPVLIREMLREFNSRQFCLFLETLTGIDNLMPDPYFMGGGIHLVSRGDFLNIHADFNWHHKLQAHRRVNVIFYPNVGWQKEWGGALEFWDKGMNGPRAAYHPMFNRVAIFNTNEDSNHGHPHKLECPENQFRKALNLYYYTTKWEDGSVHAPHFTVYKNEGDGGRIDHDAHKVGKDTAASPFARELGENYRKSADKA